MKRTFALLLTAVMPFTAAQPLAQRIGHTDPSKYRKSRSHGSVGDMACMTLIPGPSMTANLNFHYCPATSRTESIDCLNWVDLFGSLTLEVPVKLAFSQRV